MEKAHCAVIDENGEVISDPDVEIDHSARSVARIRVLNAEQAGTENPEIANVYKQYGKTAEAQSVWCLTLEQKANLFGNENRILRAENIAPNKAVQIAKDRLAAIGCDMSSYEVSIWYKAAASSAVENARHDFHYVIYFVDDFDSPAKAFSVTIHAATGEEGRIYRPERLVRTDSPYMIVGNTESEIRRIHTLYTIVDK